MAEVNIAQLATPDIIKNLPEYYGETKYLNNFIKCVDPVAQILALAPIAAQPFWFASLRNKIKGRASDRLRLNGEPGTWAAIRDCLKVHFSDQRDQRFLVVQLQTLKQNNLSIPEFYDRILELVTALNVIASEEANENFRNLIVTRNLSEGLETFMKGSKEPLKTILLSRNPPNLSDAYNIALTLNIESRNEHYKVLYTSKTHNNNHNSNNNYSYNRNNNHINPYNGNNFKNNFNNNYNNGFRNNNNNNLNRYTNNKYNNNRDGHFGNNSYQRRFDNSAPMDIENTSQVRHNFNRNSRDRNPRQQSPRIVSEELFTNENFRDQASERNTE